MILPERLEKWFLLPWKPDVSINKEILSEQISQNENAWQAAYEFLKRNDLSTLENGHYELSNGTYAAVSEYKTKDPETARYEVHRTYIDIQYVIKGEEYIEVLPLDMFKEEQHYDKDKDIIFFEENPNGTKLYADNGHFFVFFPDEAHKPGLKINTNNEEVKKVVIKIPYYPK